jgi:hypothetical protein
LFKLHCLLHWTYTRYSFKENRFRLRCSLGESLI